MYGDKVSLTQSGLSGSWAITCLCNTGLQCCWVKSSSVVFSASSISDAFPSFSQSKFPQVYWKQLFNITYAARFCISQASVNILINVWRKEKQVPFIICLLNQEVSNFLYFNRVLWCEEVAGLPVIGFIIDPELSKAFRRHMKAADILLRAWSPWHTLLHMLNLG